MHIPDGILNPIVLTSTAIAAGAVLTASVRYSKKEMDQRMVPVLGVMAAFIFAAQMVNFPLLGAAASGHLLGGALAVILFGFWPSTLLMTTVVAIQALVFQDGGITALGTNILNMAIIGPAVASLVYKVLQSIKIPRTVTVFLVGWSSVMGVALAGAIELALSGVVSFALAAKVLMFWHAFIGVGEGLITAMVLPFALKSSFGLQSEEALLQ